MAELKINCLYRVLGFQFCWKSRSACCDWTGGVSDSPM